MAEPTFSATCSVARRIQSASTAIAAAPATKTSGAGGVRDRREQGGDGDENEEAERKREPADGSGSLGGPCHFCGFLRPLKGLSLVLRDSRSGTPGRSNVSLMPFSRNRS